MGDSVPDASTTACACCTTCMPTHTHTVTNTAVNATAVNDTAVNTIAQIMTFSWLDYAGLEALGWER